MLTTKRFSLLSFIGILLVFTPVSLADPKPILKVATINIPPLAYMDQETMVVKGTITKKVQSLAEKCNAHVAFIFAPSWARAFNMALKGTADGLIPTTYAETRLKDFDYAKPGLADLGPSLIVRQDSNHIMNTGLDMLENKRVGIRANSIMGGKIDKKLNENTVSVIERADTKGLVQALLHNEVDFIIDSPNVIGYVIDEQLARNKIRILKPGLSVSMQYLALSKKRSGHFAPGTTTSDCLLGISAKAKN